MWMVTLISSFFFLTVRSSTKEDDFEYLKRTFVTSSDGEQSVSPLSDIEDGPDEWPDGSYTLLMSKYGCPRGRWNRGYISFTWQTPHVLLSHTHTFHCNSYSKATSEYYTQCHNLLSEKTWPTSHSNMFGPFSKYKMSLNFCQRMNDTDTDNTSINSRWPQAYFRLFGTNAGCPQGFHQEDATLKLPSVDKWTENGFLPYFTVNTEDHNTTIFTLRECVRDEPIEMNATHYLSTNESAFILLKHEYYPCPAIVGYDVWPEIISLAALHNSTANTLRLFQFCYYQVESWNAHDTFGNEGYELRPIKVMYGGTEDLQESLGSEDDDHTHTMFCSKRTTCWILIDMGRSFLIKNVTLHHVTEGKFNFTVQASNDKWSLLRDGGVEISSDRARLQFVGRFLVAILQHISLQINQLIDVRVLIERTDFMCMFDLGMADGRITNDKISTSDGTTDDVDAVHAIDAVRAYNSGWCANNMDSDPYIQVDLLEETVLDGITIYNWYQTEVSITNGSYRKSFTPMGTRSFTLLYLSDGNIPNNNMTFHMDVFLPADEPQTFIFYKQIIARYLRIVLLEPMTQGHLCIRFELHGCLHNAPIDKPSLIFHGDDSNILTGAVQTLTIPCQFTSVDYPLPYRDGTSYTWIIDFRKVGFIKLIFKEILLQNYEDRSYSKSWYHCRNKFSVSSTTSSWTIPTLVEHKNLIIETEKKYIVMEFMSCRPYTPRKKEGTYFIGFIIKADMPTCGHLSSRDLVHSRLQHCYFPTMHLSTLSLQNLPLKDYQESWRITIPKFSVRLSITHFHITCQSGTVLEVNDKFSPTMSYTNCNQPSSTLLSESETISLSYKIRQKTSSSSDRLMKEGFQAIYTAVEVDDRALLDTIGHDFQGMQRIEYVDTTSDKHITNATAALVYKACSVTFMKCYYIYSGEPMSWQVAGDECWARGRKMVSIRSEEELFVVKYMLRTFKYVKVDDHTIDTVFSTTVVDPNYFAHIGISRVVQTDGKQQFVWQDGSPVLFTAWNTGQPGPDGNCVRMSFHLANKNSTWEVEDCYTQLSLLFMCEDPVDSLPLQDIESVDPKTYTGQMSKTLSGRLCQRWDTVMPHNHDYTLSDTFADGNVTAAENHCRDPSDSGYLWCYTMDPNVRWEKCPVINLDHWIAGEYTGRLSTTVSGRTCQRWDVQLPHWHDRNNPVYFPDKTVSDAANYCRDPLDEVGTLWCFTTDGETRWDYCKLKDTVSDRCYRTHYPYTGTWNVTHSGLTCQRWDATYPHTPKAYPNTDFPDGSKSNAENYCRDPEDEGYVWCYTTDPDVRWEACFVQDSKPSTTETPSHSVYSCLNGNQESSQKICNGLVDCVDAQDELTCDYQVQKLLDTWTNFTSNMGTREHTQFICGNREVISFLAECDGVIDCIDGTDEKNCQRDNTECSKDEFQCGDGRCIHASLMCDFIPHCTDFSDEHCEYPGCKYGELRCENGQCIPMEYKCDAYKDCIDGSDEKKCDSCSNEAIHCDVTKCIPKRLVCDRIPDCRDRSDEKTCTDKQYPTCEERWLHGLRKNGLYSLSDNTVVECNFDNVRKDGSVLTIFQAAEKSNEGEEEFREIGMYFIDDIGTTDSELMRFISNDNYQCYQTFIQRCTIAVHTVADIEDRNLENAYQHCRCVALSVKPFEPETAFVHACNNKMQILDDSLMFINYTFLYYNGHSYLTKKKSFIDGDIEIKVGHIACRNDVFLKQESYIYEGEQNTTKYGVPCQRWDQQSPHQHNHTDPLWFPDSSLENTENFCRDPSHSGDIWCYTTDPLIRWQFCDQQYEHTDDVTTLPCDEDGLTYPASRRCIYDTDNAGYILGCRSGSHLQHCSEFICPDGTVKCPGSYCVPLHYICDGINQCPDSADELGCGCNNDDLEVILLASAEELLDDDLKLRQIAGQFNSRGSIVRLLYYSVQTDIDILPFEHMLLKIWDTEINQKDVISREHECSYGVYASDYISRVRFTNATFRGLIFLQNGTVSESTAKNIFQNMSKPDFDVYRVVMKSSSNFEQVGDIEYNFVTDITVDSLDILSSIGNNFFPSLCIDSSSTLCQYNYKCLSSKLCIAQDKVCDGHVHCPFSDDEMFCDFVCPSLCSCSGYSAYCSYAQFVNSTDISRDMDRRLRVLDLSTNIRVGEFGNSHEDFVLEFPHMIRLNLSQCNINQLGTNYFKRLPNLISLDLSMNKISRIPRRTFFGLSKLVYLNLYGNEGFMTYESYAFFGLVSLRNLDILDSDIYAISQKTFSGLELDTLKLSYNNIIEISNDAFSGLTVSKINIESNSIQTFDRGLFNGIFELKSLKSSAYKYCCIRPDYLPESACSPERDEFSSCDDLMRNPALQTMLWLMGLCALLGNILAIVYRLVYDRQRLKLGYGIFVTNLAVADLFMGIYLLIIAIADASFRQRYIFMDEYWRNSVWCTFAGVLSTISSEASVLFLCLITLDRFIVIKYPFSQLRFTPERACIAASVAWILSISISVVPLIATNHFQNKFYSKSGVCVALPLTRDRPPGWLYSVIVFIGVNFVTFIGIALGQLSIYREINTVSSKIKNRRGGKSKASRRKELTIARNLLLVVASDFLCWFPVGCMGMMAMSGYVIPGEVYAWVAVFILPVNSALNPVLYTLTAILGKRKQQDTKEITLSYKVKKSTIRRKHGMEKMFAYFLPRKEKYGMSMMSVESIIQQNMEMKADVLLKFTIQLADCLRLLHKHALILENIDTSSVFVMIEYGKITGDIQIKQHPKHGASLGNKKEDMYKLGVIVRRLMACNSKQD